MEEEKLRAHKAGYVNIIGNPNVGKSTLLNALLDEPLSIATPKAQTTRHRILGMLNQEHYQIIFSDTPGVIQPAYALQEHMMDFVKASFEDADVVLFISEPGLHGLKDPAIYETLKKLPQKLILVINKIDLTAQAELEEEVAHWKGELPEAEIFPLSAMHKFNLTTLIDRIVELLPEGPPYFDKDQLSDRNERFFVEEMIREQVLLNYNKEIPYAVEVEVEEFKEAEDIIRIRANIHVERNTQKGILVGAGGSMIKRTGTGARKSMERFFAKKVFLDLHVKVRKNWRSSEADLRRFGYKR